MSRCVSIVVAACVLLAASVVRGEDFVPRILEYFPGKWQIKAPDGSSQGSADWKLVAGGKAIAGPGTSAGGVEAFAAAGWDAGAKKWVHVWFEASGAHGCIEIAKFEANTYWGRICLVDKDGKASSGEWRNKIIDKDHFEITEVLDGKTVVMHFHRVK